MSGIRLDAVTKIYPNGVRAVDRVSLDIRLGEFVVLVGPSGCGKSTLLRMIAGLEDVTVGDIYIGDTDVTDRPPQERDIAMVFQNYALYPHMTVRDNLAYGLKLRKMPKSEWRSRVDEVASVLGLSELLGRKPAALSGGQRQRVAMGRAIVRQPAVFLFDEPLSNLDAKLRVQMRFEIQKLHRRLKTTSLYVTHDQVEAMTLAQRMIVMNAGRAEQIGTPMEVYENPASIFVAGFIGSPAMNFVPGVAEAGGRIALGVAGVVRTDVRVEPGREVTVGVRPEHLTLGAAAGSAISGTVEMIEQLGADTLVHVAADKSQVVARLPHGVSPEVGSVLALGADPSRVYVFDGKTGARIR